MTRDQEAVAGGSATSRRTGPSGCGVPGRARPRRCSTQVADQQTDDPDGQQHRRNAEHQRQVAAVDAVQQHRRLAVPVPRDELRQVPALRPLRQQPGEQPPQPENRRTDPCGQAATSGRTPDRERDAPVHQGIGAQRQTELPKMGVPQREIEGQARQRCRPPQTQ